MKKLKINNTVLFIALISVCVISCKRETSDEGKNHLEIIAQNIINSNNSIAKVVAIISNDDEPNFYLDFFILSPHYYIKIESQ